MKIVVVTPNEADGRLTAGFLEAEGMQTLLCEDLADLSCIMRPETGCVIAVEEAMIEPQIRAFHDALHAQPPWSDLPVLLIAARESSLSALVNDVFPRSGNVTLLQRPLHPLTLVSAVSMALRSRQRQLEVRDLLEQRDRAVKQRDEFLAMLAHELRNPMAPIRNAAYLLGTLAYTDPLFLKCRAMIEKQARHVTRLVDDLLDVSRLELGKVQLQMQRVDLNESLAAAVEACAPITNAHRHTVNARPWKKPLHVRADAVRLEQVIANLIVNAAKFTPERGTIDVEAFAEGERAGVAVTDNGVGIKPERLDSIFDLFTQESVTSARTEGGLGIGLTLVKRLMELHGGDVRASSAGLGSGSRFEVRFPLHGGAEQTIENHSLVGPSSAPKRILIVEDGTDARDSLGLLIKTWNHEVIFARTGPEGLHVAREERPDIALIDIGLPGLDGYQIAREIRLEGSEWARTVRLIALTGYGQAADRAKAIDSGFDVHMLKPVDPMQLKVLLSV